VTTPTEAQLADGVRRATRDAVRSLLREHPGHRFYYFVLTTPAEAYGPAFTAWSWEALEDAAGGDPRLARDLKWSYADSPFCAYGERYLEPVRALFDARPQVFDLPDDEADAEFALRLRAMEAAMAALDREGLFGTGARRLGTVLNVEIVAWDDSNLDRALRLNPAEALTDWWDEVAAAEWEQ
jgi:hypothetical protein